MAVAGNQDALLSLFQDDASMQTFLAIQEEELRAIADAQAAAEFGEALLIASASNGDFMSDLSTDVGACCDDDVLAWSIAEHDKLNNAQLDADLRLAKHLHEQCNMLDADAQQAHCLQTEAALLDHDFAFAQQLHAMPDQEWQLRGDECKKPFELESVDPLEGETDQICSGICQICLEDKSFLRSAGPCGHMFCTACLTRYIATKLTEKDVPAKCPDVTCSKHIRPQVAARFSSRTDFEAYAQLTLEAEMKNKVYCPFPECACAHDLERHDGPRILCKCNRHFCGTCHVPWHVGQTCAEFKAYNAPVDKAVLQLGKDKRWQRCPNCKHMISKTKDSCNHMVCRCKCTFCFACGLRYENREPQPGNVHGKAGCKCPLFTLIEEQRANLDAVEAGEAELPPGIPVEAGVQDRGIRLRHRGRIVERFPDWLKEHISNKLCTYCGRLFDTEKALEIHLNTTDDHQVFACCGRIFLNAASLQQHTLHKHPQGLRPRNGLELMAMD